MSAIADYANLYETQIRQRQRRRRLGGLRYLGVLAVWGVLFLMRPELALSIWRERA